MKIALSLLLHLIFTTNEAVYVILFLRISS